MVHLLCKFAMLGYKYSLYRPADYCPLLLSSDGAVILALI